MLAIISLLLTICIVCFIIGFFVGMGFLIASFVTKDPLEKTRRRKISGKVILYPLVASILFIALWGIVRAAGIA